MSCPITGYPTPIAREMLGMDRDFDLWDQADDSLVRLRRQHLRRAADFARGDIGPLDAEPRLRQARREWYQAEEIRLHQQQRFQLRMRYGAIDDHLGTTSYDCYIRHNEAPAYALALFMDSARAAHGRRHILDWPAQAVAA